MWKSRSCRSRIEPDPASALVSRASGMRHPLSAETDGNGRLADHAEIGLIPGAAVCEQQLVPADPLDDGAGQWDDSETAIRKATAHIGFGGWLNEHAFVIHPISDGYTIDSVVPVEGHVVGQKKADRGAGQYRRRERQFVSVGWGAAADFDAPGRVFVNPAAALRRHLEGGRHVQQVPAVRRAPRKDADRSREKGPGSCGWWIENG